jgi:hypothetical protein
VNKGTGHHHTQYEDNERLLSRPKLSKKELDRMYSFCAKRGLDRLRFIVQFAERSFTVFEAMTRAPKASKETVKRLIDETTVLMAHGFVGESVMLDSTELRKYAEMHAAQTEEDNG